MTTKAKPAMLQIGVTKDSILEARSAIMAILACKATEAEKVTAMRCLTRLCGIGNTSISNCTFKAEA